MLNLNFVYKSHKGKTSTMKFKSRSEHDKTKVYQNRLDTCPGFFVGGPWFRKYKFWKIPAAGMFNAKKQEKKAVAGIFENSYFRNQGPPTKPGHVSNEFR